MNKTKLVMILLLILFVAGCSPLRTAAYKGDTTAVRELLDKGANVNENFNGETVLAIASIQGHADTVKLLLDRGASVNASTGYGLTPLFYAAQRGHADVAKLLIAKGADVDAAVAKLSRLDDQGSDGVALLKRLAKKQPSGQSEAPIAKSFQDAPRAIESDVDSLPATKAKLNKNAYAIIIGIENYRQGLPKADFAGSDAKLMSEYLIKVLGYPEENVITLLNDRALKSDMEKYFDRWLINNVEENGRVFIYYSGHGAPNTKTGDAYLVPYDGDPTFIAETGYSIARLYGSLGKLKAKEITVVIDSCFSGGGGRSVLAKGAKPLVMTINMPAIQKNISAMTASSKDQISSAYEEKGHGLFTYFLLKGIKNEDVVKPDGSIKLDELYEYIKPQVERIARKQFNNEQTPQLMDAKKN